MKRDNDLVPRFWFCVLFTFPFFVRTIEPHIQWLLATIVLAVGNWSFFLKAYSKRLTVYTLFAVSLGVLYLYSMLESIFGSGHTLFYGMVGAVTVLILLEQIFERSVERKLDWEFARLAQNTPKTAHKLLIDGRIEEVAADSLKNDDTVRVEKDEIIPVDGIIFSGDLLVDGINPVVKEAGVGAMVFAGSKNLKGTALVRAVRTKNETLFSQALETAKQAINSPSPLEENSGKIASGIIVAALILSCIGMLFWSLFSGMANAVLVVSTICITVAPCGLLLSSSILKRASVIMSAKLGIVVRVMKAFEEVAACNMLVVNKNGTLTEGAPVIVSIDPAEGHTVDELLICAASLEAPSIHPYARCIVEKAKSLNHIFDDVELHEEVPGLGVKGTIGTDVCLMGDEKLMAGIDLSYFKVRAEDMRKQGYIVLFCAKGTKLLGVIVLSDPIRKDVQSTLKAFKEHGFSLFCLSGDRRITVVQLVNALGFDRFQAEAPALTKSHTVKKLQSEGKSVLMLGEPEYDSIALSQANSGASLGTKGNILQEKAPIVLLRKDLASGLRLYTLSKRAESLSKQNFAISILYTILAMLLALFGEFGPSHGALYMLLITMVMGINSLRLFLIDQKN